MTRYLVLGGSGMLGHRIYLDFCKKFGSENVACTLRKSKGSFSASSFFDSKNTFYSVDALSFDSILGVLREYKPDYIINCIGLTLRKQDVQDFHKCLELNSILPHRLAKWGVQNNCRVIHFSTDCVFDGKKGNYNENDIPTAPDIYGKSKFLGEINYPNSLTLRLSIVGREIEGKTELVEWFLSNPNKSVIKGFSNVLYSGLTTNFVAKELLRILENFPHISGTYHVSGETISKFELLKILNTLYEKNLEIKEDIIYKSDKTLNCDLYSKLTGFRRPAWKDMISDMRAAENSIYNN